MPAGLGYNPRENYGIPLSVTMQQAQQFQTGLGRQQDEKRARVQKQQMQELWQQSGGDWEKFRAAGGAQFLSPQLVQQMDAKAEATAENQRRYEAGQQAAAQRDLIAQSQDVQRRGALTSLAQERGATGPELVAVGTGALGPEFVGGLGEQTADSPYTIAGGVRLNKQTGEMEPVPASASGPKIGAKPYVYTLRDGREIVTMRYNEETGAHEEVGRGLASAGDIAEGDVDITTIAQKMINGELDPNAMSKRGATRKALFSEMERLSPGVNINDLQARFKARQDVNLNKSIAVLDSMTLPQQAGGEAILDQLETAHSQLGFREEAKVYNAGRRFVLEQTNSPELKAYDNLRNSVVFELTQALTAAAPTDKRIEVELENFPKSPSPKQMRKIIETTYEIVGARREAFVRAQGRGVAPQGEAPEPPTAPKFKILSVQ